MTITEFIAKSGENMKREYIKTHYFGDEIYIFYKEEPKVGVLTLKTYEVRNVYKAILVVQQNLTAVARAYLSEISSKFNIEVFKEAEHVLVPPTIEAGADVHEAKLLNLMPPKPPTSVEDVCMDYFGPSWLWRTEHGKLSNLDQLIYKHL
ncbi:hypothetical protein LIER_16301 [Lithospermum erythrorhizon]|uniref:Uncharacterized protein n=1 Tax=Lithospermum erythrorhizon TaxID=34254 RepID=A0AAV3Q8L7_LITER